MSTERQLHDIAAVIAGKFPELAVELHRLATIVGRQEQALDEAVANAQADAALAERVDSGDVVVAFTRRVGR